MHNSKASKFICWHSLHIPTASARKMSAGETRHCSMPGCTRPCISAYRDRCVIHQSGLVRLRSHVGHAVVDPVNQCAAPGCTEPCETDGFCASHASKNTSGKSTAATLGMQYPSSLEDLLSLPATFEPVTAFTKFCQSEFSTENIMFWLEVQQFKTKYQHPFPKEYWRNPPASIAVSSSDESNAASAVKLSKAAIEQLLASIQPLTDEEQQLAMSTAAREIFAKFLSADAECEVNLPASIILRICTELNLSRSAKSKEVALLTDSLPKLVVSVFDAAELNIWRLMDTDSFRRFQESPEAIALRLAIDQHNEREEAERKRLEREALVAQIQSRTFVEIAPELARAMSPHESFDPAHADPADVAAVIELQVDKAMAESIQFDAEVEDSRKLAEIMAEEERLLRLAMEAETAAESAEALRRAELLRIELDGAEAAKQERLRLEELARLEREAREAAERAELERLEQERLLQERLERERLERERLEQERLAEEALHNQFMTEQAAIAAANNFDFGERFEPADSGADADAELSALSDELRAIAQSDTYSQHRHSIQGSWQAETAGGCFPNHHSWRVNPQYRIRWPPSWFHSDVINDVPQQPIRLFVRLRRAREPVSAATTKKALPMGFAAVLAAEGFDRVVCIADTEKEILFTSKLSARASVDGEFEFDLHTVVQQLLDSDPTRPLPTARSISLIIIPYLQLPEATGSFVLSIRSSVPDVFLTPCLPFNDTVLSTANIQSAWSVADGTSGGCSDHSDSFLNNPQIIVRCPRRNLISARDHLVFSLRQYSEGDLVPIGFCVYQLPPTYVNVASVVSLIELQLPDTVTLFSPDADPSEQPVRVGEDALPVLQQDLLLFSTELCMQPETSMLFTPIAHQQWSERAAETPEDAATASAVSEWTMVDQFLVVPHTYQPGEEAGLQMDVMLCTSIHDSKQWTAARPKSLLLPNVGVQAVLL